MRVTIQVGFQAVRFKFANKSWRYKALCSSTRSQKNGTSKRN